VVAGACRRSTAAGNRSTSERAEIPVQTVALVGGGVVADRLRSIARDRYRFVGGDVSAAIVVLASAGPHAGFAAQYIGRGVHVVSTSGASDDVRDLLELDSAARTGGVSLVVGAAVSPGLSGLFARHLAAGFESCDELHVTVHGTAGPACAREHHRSLRGWAIGWHDGRWIERPAGSGRELCWFPEPVGARDSYRAEMPDPWLLHRSFPAVERISARRSATRRDRFTARLPMLSPPHREGGVGALRVEARGADGTGSRVTRVIGMAELIGTAASAVAGAFVDLLVAGDAPPGVVTASDADLPTGKLLAAVTRGGVRLQAFTGIPHTG
jgi:hypothetical protein